MKSLCHDLFNLINEVSGVKWTGEIGTFLEKKSSFITFLMIQSWSPQDPVAQFLYGNLAHQYNEGGLKPKSLLHTYCLTLT